MAFKLNKNDLITIYGYTKRGIEVKEYLEKQGFASICFIDQKKAYNYKTVYTYDGFKEKYKNNLCVTIIISLQNAVAHQKIAENLFEDNFNRIIFLPAAEHGNSNEMSEMRDVYNCLINQSFDIERSIPQYDEIVSPCNLLLQNGIITQSGEYTVFWTRLHNIFVNNENTQIVQENEMYYGRCLAVVEHYQALFRYFENGKNCDEEMLDRYMHAQGYVDSQGSYMQDKLEDRWKLWIIYKTEINKGMDFFISSAPKMKVNENGGLNITDGLHRCIFLYLQKMAYIPVKLETNEFNRLYNTEELAVIREFIQKNNIKQTVTPIEHPAFYNFPAEKENVEPSVLSAIQKYIGLHAIEHLNILDISDYNSYFARYISKMRIKKGSGKILSVETEMEKYYMAEHLNALFGIKNVEIKYATCEESLVQEKIIWDMVFVLGKVKNYIMQDAFWEFLDKSVTMILFIETDTKEIIWEIIEKTSFSAYDIISQFSRGNKMNYTVALKKDGIILE